MANQPVKPIIIYTPIVMSLIALAIVLQGVAEFGIDPTHYPKDEGWQAHLWQLLMVLELPFILLFIVASLQSFRRNFPIVALQLTLWVANFAAVYLLKL